MAERIQAVLREPFDPRPATRSSPPSASASPSPRPATARAEDLLRDADTAMYHAKALGKSRHQVFDSSMHARGPQAPAARARPAARHRARASSACTTSPSCALRRRRIAGFEALVRWQHPERGLVRPGGVHPPGRGDGAHRPPRAVAVLRGGVPAGRAPGSARPARTLTVSVNLSVKQFTPARPGRAGGGRAARVRARARGCSSWRSRRAWSWRTPDGAIALLRRLKALGVHIAIDDFGTGYSSLELPAAPARGHAEDRPLVRLGHRRRRPQRRDRADHRVSLAHSLGLDVVAEGVETEEQRALLRSSAVRWRRGLMGE